VTETLAIDKGGLASFGTCSRPAGESLVSAQVRSAVSRNLQVGHGSYKGEVELVIVVGHLSIHLQPVIGPLGLERRLIYHFRTRKAPRVKRPDFIPCESTPPPDEDALGHDKDAADGFQVRDMSDFAYVSIILSTSSLRCFLTSIHFSPAVVPARPRRQSILHLPWTILFSSPTRLFLQPSQRTQNLLVCAQIYSPLRGLRLTLA
jgi:hypothetical protein